MSGFINMDGSDDPAYRYKMPRVSAKVEGRGNGIKTVILGLSGVATACKRPTAEVTKFFGCELAAQSKQVVFSSPLLLPFFCFLKNKNNTHARTHAHIRILTRIHTTRAQVY